MQKISHPQTSVTPASSPDTAGGDGDPWGENEWRMPTAGLTSIVA